MALARKTLVNVNDAIGPIQMVDPYDRNGAGVLQYFSGGGTVVIEVTNDDAILAGAINAAAAWQSLTNLTDATGAAATNIAAAGAVRFEIVGWRFVRARLSVKAGANVDCALSVKIN